MNERAEPDRLYEGKEAIDALALTRMWGSSGRISWAGIANSEGVSVQLADIRFPEPVTASIYFQADRVGAPGVVQSLTLELLFGLGRTNVTQTRTWNVQPTPGVPIILNIPFQPVVTIAARVIGTGHSLGPDPVEVLCTLQASPITRIHYEKEALKFGMALPGEADGMDDAMLEDLEENAPNQAAIMRARQARGLHPLDDSDDENDEYADEEPTERGRIIVPPQFERAIARVSARLGRPARVADLDAPLRKRLLRAIKAAQ